MTLNRYSVLTSDAFQAASGGEHVTSHLVQEIVVRGSGGGPLTPLADQLNHDLTHLQGQRVEGMLARLVALVATTTPTSVADAVSLGREVEPQRPAGAVRVSEADPRFLGVHAAISVPGMPEEVPPKYVPRDVDAAEHGVRAKVAAAAQHGGFVLLVGGSSVGKTRCAVEAVEGGATRLVAGAPGRPGRGCRTGAGTVAADGGRLAHEAEGRLLYCYAIPLYRRAADADDEGAAWRLADLLARRGDLDEAEQLLRGQGR